MTQNGLFIPAPPVQCDGKGHSFEIELPKHVPRPTYIVAAAVILHTNTTPILEICGFFTLVVGKPHGQVVLVAGMNRHGAARWEHQPPIRVEKNEHIVLSYGGQMGALSAFDWLRRRWTFLPLQGAIQPDIALFWLENDKE